MPQREKTTSEYDRHDREVLAAIKGSTDPLTKLAIAEATSLSAHAVTQALSRLRSGDAPRVAMTGNKRGAKYGAA